MTRQSIIKALEDSKLAIKQSECDHLFDIEAIGIRDTECPDCGKGYHEFLDEIRIPSTEVNPNIRPQAYDQYHWGNTTNFPQSGTTFPATTTGGNTTNTKVVWNTNF